MQKPYSQASENNKEAILEVLRVELALSSSVLEVGSGTGQHAVHFAANLPHLVWRTSDLACNHAGVKQWLDEACLINVREPFSLDVRDYAWDETTYDAVFTANSLHIMAQKSAQHFIENVAKALSQRGLFIAYGPFNYGGNYTSESNSRFDIWLKQQNPVSAIRDFEWLDDCARTGGLLLHRDYEMPANNRLLIWRKRAGGTGERSA